MFKKIAFCSFLNGVPLWSAWIFATLLGGGVTFILVGIQMVYGSFYHFLGEPSPSGSIIALISGLIDGILNGLFQWVVLRKRLSRAGMWIVTTCIGIMLGWFALLVIPVTDWSVPGDEIAVFIYVMAVSRVVTSLFQWWLIRREKHAYWWILVSLISWVCADLVTVALGRDSALTPWLYIPMAGLLGSMSTATVFVWFFDRSEQGGVKAIGVGILTALLFLGGWFSVEIGFSQQIRSLRGHNGFLTSVAFSPDGSLLASASEEGNVILWDAISGEIVRTINVNKLDAPGHMSSGNDVERVLFSPDGNLLVTASDDGFFKLWEVASGVMLFENRSLQFLRMPCVAFSPDSLHLAVLGGENPNFNISIWDIPGKKQLRTLELPEKSIVTALAFSKGNQIAWLNYAEGVLSWKTEGETELVVLGDPWRVTPCGGSAAFYPDGKYLATGGGDKNKINDRAVSIWDLEQGTPLHTLSGPRITALALSPNGRILAIGRNYRYGMLLWDVVNWEEIGQLRGGNNISAIAFSPDGKLLATGSLDGVVRFWKVPAIP